MLISLITSLGFCNVPKSTCKTVHEPLITVLILTVKPDSGGITTILEDKALYEIH